jgi:carbon monoxide dehydrogenase subunit G
MIQVTGDYEFAAPQELVWEMMLDPEVLAKTIPGCEKLEQVDENTYTGRLNIRVGPVQGIFQGKVEMSDRRPPTGLHMVVNGSGPAGVVRGEGDMTLQSLTPPNAQSPSATRLHYDGQVQVSGRIATVGQRVMDSSTRSIVKQSLQSLESQIQARLAPEPAALESLGAPASSPAAPSTPATSPQPAEFMFNVARDVARDTLNDLIPDPLTRRLVMGAGLVFLFLGLVNAFANLIARRVARQMEKR